MTLDLDGPRKLLSRPELRLCLDALRAPGEETRLVGGCVRDALLGRDVADVDLATTLLPADTMRQAASAGIKAVPTGFDHGTITLVVAGERFEVTTLREDIETDGRHAVVRFGHDFSRDAERRDFTINALSVDAEGQLHDTTGGTADLEAGRVRFIGDAATRIREDALRILRFFRFHARYGKGPPDREGLTASIAARDALERLSHERIRGELLKLLVAPRAGDAVAILSETGLLARILGGVGDLGRLSRAIAVEADAVARLGALAVFSYDDVERLSEKLRLSRAETARLEAYAQVAVRFHAAAQVDGRTIRRITAEYGVRALEDAFAAIAGEPHPEFDGMARDTVRAFVEGSLAVPVFPLAGADLIATGARPGKQIGLALSAAREAWFAEGCEIGGDVADRLLAVALSAYER